MARFRAGRVAGGSFLEFSSRYAVELGGNPAIATLRQVARENPTVTLLYGAKNRQINHAVVLAEYLAADGTLDTPCP